MEQWFYKWLLKLIKDGEIIKFYKCGRWRSLRTRVLKESNNECQMCKLLGKYKRARTVHHLLHVKEQPLKALDRCNLLAVCEECHNKLHPEKFEKLERNNKKQLNEERW